MVLSTFAHAPAPPKMLSTFFAIAWKCFLDLGGGDWLGVRAGGAGEDVDGGVVTGGVGAGYLEEGAVEGAEPHCIVNVMYWYGVYTCLIGREAFGVMILGIAITIG
mmetsp:Transcript_35323/g.64772  ORF Transcript_35323/g.64772 Transcript_35323/m.64772 type:complete len:106 (+) Transcript_35323:166-483(+)